LGLWDASADREIQDDADILNGCNGEVIELGLDELPEGVDDIRGLIQNEPERVFALVSEDGHIYFGLNCAEAAKDVEPVEVEV
jgi:hypothetical protein